MEMREDKVNAEAKDEAALRETLLLYGRGAYARLYEKRGDKAKALKALREAMAELTASAGGLGEDELSEETLYERADKAQERMLLEEARAHDEGGEEARMTDPVEEFRANKPEEEHPEEKRKVKVGSIISMVFAVMLIIVALWMLTGLLMSMGVIGKLDLGYEWFNGNIVDWF